MTGEHDAVHRERMAELRARLAAVDLPPAVGRRVAEELARLERLAWHSPASAYGLELVTTLLDLPWDVAVAIALDLGQVRAVLDAEHLGHDGIKEGALDWVAVGQLKLRRGLRSGLGGHALAFVGPPGLGKRGLARAIAAATRRPFASIRLAGLGEGALRGDPHDRVGARPGRLVEVLLRARVNDPVVLLQDLDLVPADSALVYALRDLVDASQNRSFLDVYLDEPIDLSNVTFIAPARSWDAIPERLRDHFDVFEFMGYGECEKLRIAREFLVPTALAESGLTGDDLLVDEEAIRTIIRDYTHETGVEQLARRLAEVVAKAAARRVSGTGSLAHIGCTDVLDGLRGRSASEI